MSAGKLLAIKAAVIVTALSGGGVALAASTGHMPSQPGGHASVASAASASSKASSDRSRHTPSPSPSMHGLCQAYTSGAGSSHGKNLGNPAFTALINAAGGKANVPSYCATVLASAHHGKPGPHTPGASGKSPGHASAQSPGHASAQSSGRASGQGNGEASAHSSASAKAQTGKG